MPVRLPVFSGQPGHSSGFSGRKIQAHAPKYRTNWRDNRPGGPPIGWQFGGCGLQVWGQPIRYCQVLQRPQLLQLVTYLEALRSQYGVGVDQLFGAMYLHMQEPKLDLRKAKSFDDLAQQASAELVYKGLFADQEKQFLADGAYHLNNATYETEELETLLTYNQSLFLDAAQSIRKGVFLINPYTEDGRSVKGEQLKSITHFEADHFMGPSPAPAQITKPR